MISIIRNTTIFSHITYALSINLKVEFFSSKIQYLVIVNCTKMNKLVRYKDRTLLIIKSSNLSI
ncbi:hypothetical protein T4B_3759 [Trichinella pseudospiralis]|uniref:Uncharacterized protein n=1 Tax=Trichinella pseudospiralis TaxID=6337 RepID=A0A0V1JEL7_TRIPS|nr:hypothetical protein T4B_3759 [Trichinella pseudospiralis]